MIKTRRRRWTYPLSILMMLFTLPSMAGRVMAQKETYNTLELVKVYQSEAEFKAAHPELFPQTQPHQAILREGDEIKFVNPATGTLYKKMQVQPLTFSSDEEARMARSDNTEPVMKRAFEYQNYGDRFLIISEHQLEIYNKDETHAFDPAATLKKELYNYQGEKLADLPLAISFLVIAPDTQSFVAFDANEDGFAKSVYFYSQDGTLLNQHKINVYPIYEFTPNSQYVKIYNGFGDQFYVFTRKGRLVTQGDSTDYNPTTDWPLDNVFLSNDGGYILLNVGKLAILLDSQGRKRWELETFVIGRALFASLHNLLLLYVEDHERRLEHYQDSRIPLLHKVLVLSLDSGQILEEIKGVADCHFIGENINLNIEGRYYEYEIK